MTGDNAEHSHGPRHLKSLTGKPERTELREALRADKARLTYLDDIPPLEALACGSPAWRTADRAGFLPKLECESSYAHRPGDAIRSG